MGLTYAIPDLHGRLDLLEQALRQILEHANGSNACVVALGDYVDRGPESQGVLEFLMTWPFPSLRLVALKGNHEAMMWEACNNLVETDWWLENGGEATLASYGGLHTGESLRTLIPERHLQWVGELPTVYADQHRIFVHAGVDPRLPLHQQNERTLLWKRYSKGSSQGHGMRHVVHGHHANEQGPVVCKGRTNLDVMAWRTGRLVVGVFSDDKAGGAVEFLEVRGNSSLS